MDEQPTALEDPWTIVEEFRNAAVKAKEADFDGVESELSPSGLTPNF
jgi:2,4-dienoyl-CoA reductase-like NADH-dependent reductase (Old Yellow Enzyme family)